jgi:MoxR-like ATPase
VIQYAMRLARATRVRTPEAPDFCKEWLSWGAGPRASQYLILGAKARAAMDGRAMPDLEDVQAMALPVLSHRVVLNFQAEAEGISAASLIGPLTKE